MKKKLYSLQNNKDLAVRIQDKGSRFVVVDTNDYTEKMDKYFSDTRLDSDLTKDIISNVSNRAEKWLAVG